MPDRLGFRKKLRKCLLPMLLALTVVALVTATALARAGGGGGYHSSGGGGHSSGGGHGSGGGGGGGELIWDLIVVLVHYPVIGLPVLIAIILFFVFSAKQGNTSYQGSVIRRGTLAMRDTEKAEAINGIRAHDPNFDESTLCARVSGAFIKIQAAWCAQDLSGVRPFISDGVHERFLLQFEEQRAEGYRDHMEEIRIDSAAIVSVFSEGLFDEVAVRIAATARDWRESLADGRRISGAAAAEPFVEIWSFLRHRTAVTDPSRASLLEGNCPNCGAPIELNQSANCTHCKALLRSGAYDWVLSEITQESEWHEPGRAELPGVAAMRERDPEFDTVSIEDRVSVMFWRKSAADRKGKIDPLRKIASPEFTTRYGGLLKGGAGQRRPFAGDCAVGAVETLGVIVGGPRERALATVKWSGKRFVAEPDGGITHTNEDLWSASLFVLSRDAGALTDAGKSISSAHCPSCGAPESGGRSDACEFCGQVLNDGLHGWVLDDVFGQNDPMARALIDEMRRAPIPLAGTGGQAASGTGGDGADGFAGPDPRGLLAWMVKVATADGNVDPREQAQLTEFASRWNVPPPQVSAMVAAGLRGDLAVPDPHDAAEARAWISAMAAEAYADGKLDRSEMNLITGMGTKAGLADAEITQIVRDTRMRLLTEAREALTKKSDD